MSDLKLLAEKKGFNLTSFVLLFSIVTSIFLCIIKSYGSVSTGSLAILASLFDSLLDIAASFILFIAHRYSMMPADDNHRFGHKKAEPLSIFIQSIIIFISTTLLMREVVFSLFAEHKIEKENIAITTMVISFIASIVLVGAQTIIIKLENSEIVKSDRLHYIGDILMNGGLLFSVFIATRFQIFYIDIIVAFIAAMILLFGGIKIISRALPQLLDEEISQKDKDKIIEIITSHKKVLGFHDFRSRRAGDHFFIQFHLEFDPSESVKTAHDVVEEVEEKILNLFPNSEIFIHQDPKGMDTHDDNVNMYQG